MYYFLISFINSSKRLSIAIDKDRIFFNNSLGDITAVEAKTGKLLWQTFTFKSNIYEELMSLKNSDIIINEGSLYFSNNKNEFHSVDLKTGSINWKNEVNSTLTPIILDDFIFTVSEEGYLFVIQKNKGNIIRINNLYKSFKEKKRKSLKPIGFIVGDGKLYLTNNNGTLIVVDLLSGSVINEIKIGRGEILQPYIQDQSLYLIKNGSIVKYD